MPRDVTALVQKALGDRYVIEHEIGRGATARIFLAHDRAGAPVALKMLHPELLVDIAAERFLREMRLVAQLDHPHIGRMLDSGEQGWLLYYVMPFIEGPSLRERLDALGALDLAATARLADELLDALAHAHAHGVVHRDVKPENVVLSETGAVLLDFGIARAFTVAGGDRVTRAGLAVGSPAYMSPEQARGAPEIDPRADVYAMGCVLFECLAGRPPYTHLHPAVLLQLQQTAPIPDLRALRPDVPAELAGVIARALAKAPDDRWPSAVEMRSAVLAAAAAGTHPTSDR
jgi:eukaryotic-like serine/threonine-protein kinase